MELATPFINPNRSIDHQLLLAIVILCALDKTSRKKEILSYERFVLYSYLISNPKTLNDLLTLLGKKKSLIFEYEKTRLSLQTTTKLFEDHKLKIILQLLISNGFASTVYSDDLGLLYVSMPKSEELLREIDTKYLDRLCQRAESMRALQSTKVFKLTTLLSQIINR